MGKLEQHSCNNCGKEHDDYGYSVSGEYLDYGFCSAECFYIFWIKNPKYNTFVPFPDADNYGAAYRIFKELNE